jgi:PadR family transcriptional regulator PadR
MLILRTPLPGPANGHAIVKAIERNSEELLLVEQGSLYPALHRLIKRGWIGVSEGTENNRREILPPDHGWPGATHSGNHPAG